MATINSDNKVLFCKKQVKRAEGFLAKFPNEIADSAVLVEKLAKMKAVLVENPETGNLDALFNLAKQIIEAGKLAEKAVKATEEAKMAEKRQKAEQAIERKFRAASAQLLRNSLKMGEIGESLNKEMADAATSMTNLSGEANLQWLFELCERVFSAINDHLNEQVLMVVEKTHNGWQVAKDGGPARYAVPYLATETPSHVLAWIANKPVLSTDHRAFKAWRQEGWDMVYSELKYPFGACPNCGQEPLLPYQKKGQTEWLPGRLGRLCYQAQSKSDTIQRDKAVEYHTPRSTAERNVMQNSQPMDTTGMTDEQLVAFYKEVKRARLEKKKLRSQKNKEHGRKQENHGKGAPRQPAALTPDEVARNNELIAEALARSGGNKKSSTASAPKKPAVKGKKPAKKGKGGDAVVAGKAGQKDQMFGSMQEMAEDAHNKKSKSKSKTKKKQS